MKTTINWSPKVFGRSSTLVPLSPKKSMKYDDSLGCSSRHRCSTQYNSEMRENFTIKSISLDNWFQHSIGCISFLYCALCVRYTINVSSKWSFTSSADVHITSRFSSSQRYEVDTSIFKWLSNTVALSSSIQRSLFATSLYFTASNINSIANERHKHVHCAVARNAYVYTTEYVVCDIQRLQTKQNADEDGKYRGKSRRFMRDFILCTIVPCLCPVHV